MKWVVSDEVFAVLKLIWSFIGIWRRPYSKELQGLGPYFIKYPSSHSNVEQYDNRFFNNSWYVMTKRTKKYIKSGRNLWTGKKIYKSGRNLWTKTRLNSCLSLWILLMLYFHGIKSLFKSASHPLLSAMKLKVCQHLFIIW